MGTTRRLPAGGDGFSFIETMVAMALLAFIVGDLAMVMMLASRSSGSAQRLAVAVSLAENALEHARNADFKTLGLNTDCFSLDGAGVDCAGAHFFERKRTVTPLGGVLNPDPLAVPPEVAALSVDVDVVVSWADAKGAAQHYRIMSVISRY